MNVLKTIGVTTLVFSALVVCAAEVEMWRSQTGTSVEAAYVRLTDEDIVVLETAQGERLEISVHALDAAGQERVRARAKAEQEERQSSYSRAEVTTADPTVYIDQFNVSFGSRDRRRDWFRPSVTLTVRSNDARLPRPGICLKMLGESQEGSWTVFSYYWDWTRQLWENLYSNQQSFAMGTSTKQPVVNMSAFVRKSLISPRGSPQGDQWVPIGSVDVRQKRFLAVVLETWIDGRRVHVQQMIPQGIRSLDLQNIPPDWASPKDTPDITYRSWRADLYSNPEGGISGRQ